MADLDFDRQCHLFADRHSGDVRYVADWERWIYWDGKRWCPDQQNGTALHLTAALRRGVGFSDSKSNAGHRALLERLEKWPGIKVALKELDTHPTLLNTPDGVVDQLSGTVSPHDPALLLTQLTGSGLGCPKECPTWKSFLAWYCCNDGDLARYRLRLIGGEWIIGKKRRQKMWFEQGRGENGKTTFLSALCAILGDYAGTAAPGLVELKENDTHPSEIADLYGKRLAIASEIKPGSKIDIAKVKRMTGDPTLKARRMREDWWEFPRLFSLVGAVNDLPELNSSGLGDWRRMEVLPAYAQVDKDDPDLMEKLVAEGPGFLTVLIHEGVAYRREEAVLPDAVKRATNRYRNRNDSLSAFQSCCCVVANDVQVQSRNLFEAYRGWCDSQGMDYVSEVLFARRMAEQLGFVKKVTKVASFWQGIELKPLDQWAENE